MSIFELYKLSWKFPLTIKTKTTALKPTRLKNLLQKALFSPFVLAIIPALLILYFLPLKFEKYEASIVSVFKIGKNQPLLIKKYADLNGDGKPEKIQLGSRKDIDSSLFYIQVMTENYQFRDEWLLNRGGLLQKSDIVYFDSDDNGSSEVFFFTQSKDSVFLNHLDPFPNFNVSVQSTFIDLIAPDRGGTYDVIIKSLGFSDRDADGIFEFTFGISAGYCRQPRKLYCFYPFDKKLNTSDNTAIGLNLSYPVSVCDMDGGDLRNEYLISTSDFKNYSEIQDKTSYTYIDTCAWVLAYDDDLSLLFDPPIPITNINFLAGLIHVDDQKYFYYTETSMTSLQQQVIIRDAKGVIFKQFALPPSSGYLISALPTLSAINQKKEYILRMASAYSHTH